MASRMSVLVGRAAVVEVGLRGHEHARRADAALGPAVLEEGLLQRVESLVLGVGQPSTVRISEPSTWQTGTRQLSTTMPSRMTVQAPHSPSPQPSLVPVRPRSSRSDVEQPAHARHRDLARLAVEREAVGRIRATPSLLGRRSWSDLQWLRALVPLSPAVP